MDLGIRRAVDSQKLPVSNRYQPGGRPRPLRAPPSTRNLAECVLGRWLYPNGWMKLADARAPHDYLLRSHLRPAR